jgi:hypothetical protein
LPRLTSKSALERILERPPSGGLSVFNFGLKKPPKRNIANQLRIARTHQRELLLFLAALRPYRHCSWRTLRAFMLAGQPDG